MCDTSVIGYSLQHPRSSDAYRAIETCVETERCRQTKWGPRAQVAQVQLEQGVRRERHLSHDVQLSCPHEVKAGAAVHCSSDACVQRAVRLQLGA